MTERVFSEDRRQKCLVMMRQKTEVFSEVFSDDETEDRSVLVMMRQKTKCLVMMRQKTEVFSDDETEDRGV